MDNNPNMEARKRNIVAGFVVIAFSIIINVGWLHENCTPLDNNCRGLILFGGIVTVLTILYIENNIRRQKKRGEWYDRKQETHIPRKKNPKRVWIISIGRILLTTLLLSLSMVVQGGFVMLVSGVLFGMGLDGLIRGLTGNIPPIKPIDE